MKNVQFDCVFYRLTHHKHVLTSHHAVFDHKNDMRGDNFRVYIALKESCYYNLFQLVDNLNFQDCPKSEQINADEIKKALRELISNGLVTKVILYEEVI